MSIGMIAYNTHKTEPAEFLKGKESLSDYQNKKKETITKRDERKVMDELNKMFL